MCYYRGKIFNKDCFSSAIWPSNRRNSNNYTFEIRSGLRATDLFWKYSFLSICEQWALRRDVSSQSKRGQCYRVLYTNINQKLVNSLHGVLKCEIAGLDCRVIATDCIHMYHLFCNVIYSGVSGQCSYIILLCIDHGGFFINNQCLKVGLTLVHSI